MPYKPLLIGLTGRANAGKSTVAQLLEKDYAFTELALADPILDMVHALFAAANIDGAWAVARSLKEQPTRLGYSYRQLAQTLGTEWARTLSPDFWLRVLALLVLLAGAVAMFFTSETGRQLIAFGRDAVKETKKVVWPARKEAMQMTGYVFAFVVVMALFLFLTDKTLEWVLYDLILGWKR